MNQISFKKIGIAALVLLLLSHIGRIREFVRARDFGGILTLEPLRNSPEEGRFLVTVALCVLVFVVLWSLFTNRK